MSLFQYLKKATVPLILAGALVGGSVNSGLSQEPDSLERKIYPESLALPEKVNFLRGLIKRDSRVSKERENHQTYELFRFEKGYREWTAHSYEIKFNENSHINLHELHFKNGEKESMLFIVNKGLFFADKNCNGLGDDQNYLNSRPYYETSEKEYEKALNEILRNLIIHQIFQ